jgi:hypothetical protein
MSLRDCDTVLIFLFARVYERNKGFILFYLFFSRALEVDRGPYRVCFHFVQLGFATMGLLDRAKGHALFKGALCHTPE